jgi:hypothetical protein
VPILQPEAQPDLSEVADTFDSSADERDDDANVCLDEFIGPKV